MKTSNRIIVNAIAQYIRSIANMLFSLIATRLILRTLGVEDYGIYSLIAGIVSMISFVTNALTITTQRFLSVAQGFNSDVRSREVFNTSLFLHLAIALLIILILEALSPLIFNGSLNIPIERLSAAKFLYQTTIAVLFLSFVSSPYKACIVAYENIVFTSIVEIIDGLLKLLIAIVLSCVPYDKLEFYGASLVLIYIFNLLAWRIYSKKNYSECNNISIKKIRTSLIQEIMGFASWTIYSIGCVTGRSQGIAIVINKSMGTVANAAYGLAFQVSGAIISLSQSLLNAINPQLMKAEGAGNRRRMIRFSEIQSKFALFLLSAMVIPSVFEMPRLLEIWLGEVPEYAVLFCRMVLIANCMDMLTIGLNSANQAIGKIRNYTVLIYTVKLSTLIFVIVGFLLGKGATFMCVIYVLIETLSSILRIPFLARTGGLNVTEFTKNVFVYEIIPLTVLIITCLLVTGSFTGEYRFIFTFGISIILYILSIYWFGLAPDEKNIINSLLAKIISGKKSGRSL